MLMNSELLLDHGLDIWLSLLLIKGNPLTTFHLLLYTWVLRVLLWVMSLLVLSISLMVIFILFVFLKSNWIIYLKWVLFGNVAPITVTAHTLLNCSKGVVRNWELARTGPEDIKIYCTV